MKTNWLVVAIALTLASPDARSAQSGTAFTYQGRLTDGGNPADGIYDLRFAIYDSLGDPGAVLAGPLTNTATALSNGLFSVTLDFGAGVFTGADRWLEIGVRTNGGTSAFTTLAPRQPLTPAPYALYAPNAGAAVTAASANAVAAANIIGAIPDARLSSNVALLNGNANFTGTLTAATFSGSGAGLTNVPAGSLAGTIADERLSANIARLNVPNTAAPATGHPILTSGFITGAVIDNGGSGYTTVPAVAVNDPTGSNAVITVAISTDGVVTNLSVQNAGGGYSANATLTIAPPPSNAYQVFASSNYFNGVNLLTNANNVVAGSFAGNGSGLDTLNASALASGTVPDARLSANVARANQVWLLGGNSGTLPGVNFLGTTDAQPLELKVQGQRALRLEPNTNGAPNVIGGAPVNFVDPGIVGATIAGGGAVAGDFFLGTGSNHVSAIFGTIGGGRMNTVGADHAFIGGGIGNTVQSFAYDSVIGGGVQNTIQTNSFRSLIGGGSGNAVQGNLSYSTIVGGAFNTVRSNASYAAIGGGYGNSNGGSSAVVAGGFGNVNMGDLSTVGGGYLNRNTAQFGTVGGGNSNTNQAYSATIAGGQQNFNIGYAAAIGGGQNNAATNQSATVAGGQGNLSGGFVATVGGGQNNISAGDYATIAGGYFSTNTGYASTIGGGYKNTSAQTASTIAGGDQNFCTNAFAAVGGGSGNIGGGYASTIAGGQNNNASGVLATISGGSGNTIGTNADYATIPGGYGNRVVGQNSLAAGKYALANGSGSFIWNSFPNTNLVGGDNIFSIFAQHGLSVDYFTQRSDGGGNRWVYIGDGQTGPIFNRINTTILAWNGAYLSDGGSWTSSSDRARKGNFASVDARSVLERVAALPIQTWNYTNEPPSLRHLGPVAQDFHAAFGLNGGDDKHISDIDEGGVALAAIQGLNQRLTEELKRRDTENAELKQRLEALENIIRNQTSN